MARAPKAHTLLQRMGFADPDLGSPAHDWILLEWLTKEELHRIGDRLFPHQPAIDGNVRKARQAAAIAVRARIEQLERGLSEQCFPHWQRITVEDAPAARKEIEQLKQWPGLGDPPATPRMIIESPLDERPLVKGTDRYQTVVGFIDRYVTFRHNPVLSIDTGSTTTRFFPGTWAAPTWRVEWSTCTVAFEVKSSIPSYGELLRQLQVYRTHIDRAVKIAVVSPDDRYAGAIEGQGFIFIKCAQPPMLRPRQDGLFGPNT